MASEAPAALGEDPEPAAGSPAGAAAEPELDISQLDIAKHRVWLVYQTNVGWPTVTQAAQTFVRRLGICRRPRELVAHLRRLVADPPDPDTGRVARDALDADMLRQAFPGVWDDAQALRGAALASIESPEDAHLWLAVNSDPDEPFDLAEFIGKWQEDSRSWDRTEASTTAKAALDELLLPERTDLMQLTEWELRAATKERLDKKRFAESLGVSVKTMWTAVLWAKKKAEEKAEERAEEAGPEAAAAQAEQEQELAALRRASLRRVHDQHVTDAAGQPKAALKFTVQPLLDALAVRAGGIFVPELAPTGNPYFDRDMYKADQGVDGAVVALRSELHTHVLPVVTIAIRNTADPSDAAFQTDMTRVRLVAAAVLRYLGARIDEHTADEFFANAKVFGFVCSRTSFVIYRMQPVRVDGDPDGLSFVIHCHSDTINIFDGVRGVAKYLTLFTEAVAAEASRTVHFIKTAPLGAERRVRPQLVLPTKLSSRSDDDEEYSWGDDDDEEFTSGSDDREREPGGAQGQVEALLAHCGFTADVFDLDEQADFDALKEGRTQVVQGNDFGHTLVLKQGRGALREENARRLLRQAGSRFIPAALYETLLDDVLVLVLRTSPRVGCLPPYGDAGCRRVAIDVLGGLQELHALRLVHRDVKPDNILLDIVSQHAFLNDFDLATNVDDLCASGAGTRGFVAPEARPDGDGEHDCCFEGEQLDQYRAGVPEAFDVRCTCEPPHAPGAAIDLWGLGVSLVFLYDAPPRQARVWTELGPESTATEIVECLLNPCPESRGTAAGVRERLVRPVRAAGVAALVG